LNETTLQICFETTLFFLKRRYLFFWNDAKFFLPLCRLQCCSFPQWCCG